MPSYTILEDEQFVDQAVHEEMLGVNFVTSNDFEFVNNETNFALLESIGTTSMRFPGGSITEDHFAEAAFLTGNWEASTSTYRGETVTLTPMSAFFEIAGSSGNSVQLVLPTRVAFEQSAGQALASGNFGSRTAIEADYLEHIDQFITESLRLAQLNGVTIDRFEIGNEFWGSGEMSAAEYGHLAGVLSNYLGRTHPEIDLFVQIVSSANFFSPTSNTPVYLEPDGTGDYIIHQTSEFASGLPQGWLAGTIPGVGNARSNNLAIANEFKAVHGAVENLDGAVTHVYFSDGFAGIDGEQDYSLRTAFDHFSTAVSATNELDYLISEWSPRRTDARGLDYAHTMIEAFFELTSNGVDAASAWPLTFANPNTLGRILIDTNEGDLSFGGVAFSWLSNTVGLKPMFDYEVSGEIDIHGYGDDSTLLSYVAERSGEPSAPISIYFGRFGFSESAFVTVIRLWSNDGTHDNNAADPLLSYDDGFVTLGNTVSLNLAPYELAMVTLQAITDGDDQIFGSLGNDSIKGANGNDTLKGDDGDDALRGEGGNDVLDGGNGDDLLSGGIGHDVLTGGSGEDEIFGYTGDDTIFGGEGDDLLKGESGNDVVTDGSGADAIELGDGMDLLKLFGDTFHTADHFAFNVSSINQVGTGVLVNLNGLACIEAVTDGGSGIDTIQLSEIGDAFFLHDALSGFHESLTLSTDSAGLQSTARFSDVEEIQGRGGNDIIDMTSPDYSLRGQSIKLDGGDGNDIIWGSDANETIFGGNGNDTLFSGTGEDRMTGGSGADVFEFTRTSTSAVITDFNPDEGDTLRFYNRGGAQFDSSSVHLTSTGFGISFFDTVSHVRYGLEIVLTDGVTPFHVQVDELISSISIL